MNIKITSRKFKARESLKDFVYSEIDSLQKFNDQIMNAEVILSYQNIRDSIKSAEIILQVPGQTLRATEESDDYGKSIAGAVEKMTRQLKKIKNKKLARVK
jgi:ribosome hibernation promoting factor